jgi:acyl-CoA hydrolase
MTRRDRSPTSFADADQLADAIIRKVGKTIVLALPLGLGKANHIANALLARAAADPTIRLTIFTALTLEPPRARQELERRFLAPVSQRLFAGYPVFAYAQALRDGTLPDNIRVDEFFFQAGQWLNVPRAQQNYISANYTHALRYVLDRGVNVIAQLVARRERDGDTTFSLSCNPDLTVDLLAARREGRADFVLAGQVNSQLPFMTNDAEIEGGELDFLLDTPETDFPLFAPPREPISLVDYAIGLHAASLVRDGGTLQIGIGSLGDALAHSLILRHRQTEDFRSLLTHIRATEALTASNIGPFEQGLYGCSEMFVEGLLDLHKAGILKRDVDGALLHAAFFVGSRAFYEALRAMNDEERAKFHMTPVSYVNELYGDEAAKRRARVKASFVNDAMMATLLGDVISDGLANGQVVSGVGGQYNFVSQAFALNDARAIIVLRSHRTVGGSAKSNILWNYPHTTIPRHLRDIVITEYGIADLRGKSDCEVITAMLAIADSRYQGELLRQAKDAGKINKSFELPRAARENTPEAIAKALQPAHDSGLLPWFPFGSDFTDVEQKLLPVLISLKAASRLELATLILRGLRSGPVEQECLARMGLERPATLTERVYALVLRGALATAR